MSIDRPFQGGLFSGDYLGEAIEESGDLQAFDDVVMDELETKLSDAEFAG